MTQVIFDPYPRTADLIFTSQDWSTLQQRYQIIQPPTTNDLAFYQSHIENTQYIIGQPPLNSALLKQAKKLKAIFNVESNFLDNMDYDICFEQGIHVLATSPVFAKPVAELGLGMALSLLRDIPAADQSFRTGNETYGLESNATAGQLSGSRVGFIGFGDLGVALNSLLRGFQCDISIYDPWLPDTLIHAIGAKPVDLNSILSNSDVIFIVAAATDKNQGALGKAEFARMTKGTSVILLSRASVVNFDAMIHAVQSEHIRVATDVFPIEPVATDDPLRQLSGMVLSAHRAGATDAAFKQMGHIVLEDMNLIDQGLAPKLCKRAERETVRRFRSKPVDIN